MPAHNDSPVLDYSDCPKCGQRWGYSRREPSPVTADGCPHCDKAAAAAMALQNNTAVRAALEKLLSAPASRSPEPEPEPATEHVPYWTRYFADHG